MGRLDECSTETLKHIVAIARNDGWLRKAAERILATRKSC